MRALPWIVAGVGIGAMATYLILNEPGIQSETGWDSVDDAANRTWRWGSRSRLAGAGANVAGKLKEGVGRALGDNDLADEGVVDQTIGAAKNAAGKVAHAAGETLHELNV
jgi:uncharacterized protein YjbJ (UPF0337 family)